MGVLTHIFHFTVETLVQTGISTAILALSIYLCRHAIRAFFEKHLQQEISKHKQALDEKTELLKHDLHKEILHAQLNAEKRHQIYTKMCALLIKTMDFILQLNPWGLKMVRDYSRDDITTIAGILDSKACSAAEKNKILAELSSDKATGIEELKRFMRRHEVHQALYELREAINFYRLNQLYMSETTAAAISDFLGSLNRIGRHYELSLSYEAMRTDKETEIEKIEKEISSLAEHIIRAMQHEMSM